MGRRWGVIVLIALTCVVFIWLIKAPILSSYFSRKMGVKVSMGSVSIWPSHMKVKRFRLHNPKGFQSKTAFRADVINMRYFWKELTGDPNVIDEIVLDHVDLDIELLDPMGRSNNWTALIDRMPASSDKSNRFIIKKLTLNDVKVKISGMGLKSATQTKTIAQMEFYNIDNEKGFPTEELISKIFGDAGLMQYIEHVIPGGGILKVLPFGMQRKEAEDCSSASRFKDWTKVTFS